ncbi:hypothetical protein AX16_008307, partial [Volvariella volvacea WC 439]
QKKYLKDVLNQYHISNNDPVSTPLSSNFTFVKNDYTTNADTILHFQSMIGSLLYATMSTQPDIAFPVIKLAQTKLQDLYCYSDFDWAEDKSNCKSTARWVYFLLNTTINWLLHKQDCIMHSSTEAEYIALMKTAKQAAWYRNLFQELQIPFKTIKIQGDNKGSIHLATNHATGKRSKHIEIRYHYIYEVLKGHFLISQQDNEASLVLAVVY